MVPELWLGPGTCLPPGKWSGARVSGWVSAVLFGRVRTAPGSWPVLWSWACAGGQLGEAAPVSGVRPSFRLLTWDTRLVVANNSFSFPALPSCHWNSHPGTVSVTRFQPGQRTQQRRAPFRWVEHVSDLKTIFTVAPTAEFKATEIPTHWNRERTFTHHGGAFYVNSINKRGR